MKTAEQHGPAMINDGQGKGGSWICSQLEDDQIQRWRWQGIAAMHRGRSESGAAVPVW